jgi:FkbM family methyltransferase
MIAKVHGMRIYTDPADVLKLKQNGVYEPVTTRWLNENLKPEWNVIDVGAHIGYHTLLFSKKCKQVFAFEPDPENFEILERNLRMNKIGNVSASVYAISDKEEQRPLYKNENSGDTRVYDPGADYRWPQRSKGPVHARPLDSFSAFQDRPIHLVKIDTQGWESRVIIGMEEILNKNHKIAIICEWSPYDMKRSQTGPTLFLHMMMRKGFEIWEFNKWTKRTEKVDRDELMERVTEENMEHADLLFLRGWEDEKTLG